MSNACNVAVAASCASDEYCYKYQLYLSGLLQTKYTVDCVLNPEAKIEKLDSDLT